MSIPINLGDNKLVALRKRGINAASTPAGAEFVAAVTDPFPDYQSGIVRAPAEATGPTVARRYRWTKDFLVPAGWSAVVLSTPTLNGLSFGGVSIRTTSTPDDLGGSIAYTVPAGPTTPAMPPRMSPVSVLLLPPGFTSSGTVSIADTVPYPKTEAGGELTQVPQVMPLTIQDDVGGSSLYRNGVRFVSGGYELINTTAAIDRSGSLTTSRIYGGYRRIDRGRRNTATVAMVDPMLVVNMPPVTASEATAVPNSLTWAAAEGAYVVFAPSDGKWRMKQPKSGLLGYVGPSRAQDGVFNQYGWAFPSKDFTTAGAGTAAATPSGLIWNESYIAPTSTVISGLSADATFRLDLRINLEVPAITTDELSIASNPPAYDPHALNVAYAVLMEMPVATPVRNNASGDWLRAVLATMARIAPFIASAVPHPVAKTAIGFAGQVAGLGHAAMERHRAASAKPKPEVNQRTIDASKALTVKFPTPKARKGLKKKAKR